MGLGIKIIFFQNAPNIELHIFDYDHVFVKVTLRHMKHNKRSKNDTKFLKLRHNWASSLQTGQGIQKIFF